MSLDSIITIAVTALVTGASNALGVWMISRHVIGKIERNNTKKQEEKK